MNVFTQRNFWLALAVLVFYLPVAWAEESTPIFETTVRAAKNSEKNGRAASQVTRREFEERLPRSAPDALRYEPGVYVQQTAHSQGSAYIRGRTGQQTVMMFDGIRLNNSTFRQGPNQYFFTVDPHVISRIEVQRGGASTLYGSDAISGVINAWPLAPTWSYADGERPWHLRAMMRMASADLEGGGRVQIDAKPFARVAFLGGVGWRRAGELKAAGPLLSPSTKQPTLVPRFDADGETQLGTGFKELTADGRLLWQVSEHYQLTAAAYDYRQFAAPRTDMCPPPTAPRGDCLTFEEQFRDLAYLTLEGQGRRATLAYQNQHERRKYDRPSSLTINGGRDDVHTLALLLAQEANPWSLTTNLEQHLRAGLDLYGDLLSSKAWTEFTDMQLLYLNSRGQYLEGSQYWWTGLYAHTELIWRERYILRGGGRFTATLADAPADAESGTAAIARHWLSLVGQVGAEWKITPRFSWLVNLDRSFRAPNLDDLTSRQQTGPGFQFENSALDPETALTGESGFLLDFNFLQASLWGFYTKLRQTIERAPRSIDQCPPQTPQCNSSWNRFQLINLPDEAKIWGTEAIAQLYLPRGFSSRATIAFAQGDGPNPASGPARLPLSRIPPLNGTWEARWRHRLGFFSGLGLRWALTQDRLSLADQSDARIPEGGTPGFAVWDVRVGYRLGQRFLVGGVAENIFNTAYRYHGSSINGAKRGIILNIEGQL